MQPEHDSAYLPNDTAQPVFSPFSWCFVSVFTGGRSHVKSSLQQ